MIRKTLDWIRRRTTGAAEEVRRRIRRLLATCVVIDIGRRAYVECDLSEAVVGPVSPPRPLQRSRPVRAADTRPRYRVEITYRETRALDRLPARARDILMQASPVSRDHE